MLPSAVEEDVALTPTVPPVTCTPPTVPEGSPPAKFGRCCGGMQMAVVALVVERRGRSIVQQRRRAFVEHAMRKSFSGPTSLSASRRSSKLSRNAISVCERSKSSKWLFTQSSTMRTALSRSRYVPYHSKHLLQINGLLNYKHKFP